MVEMSAISLAQTRELRRPVEIDWRDGFGTWTPVPETELTDNLEQSFADGDAVIGDSGSRVEWFRVMRA